MEDFQKAQQEWQAQLQKHQNERPDFICKQTGLPVRGRSWKEAGCLSPDLCLSSQGCDNGGYAAWAKEMDETIEAMYNAYDQDAIPETAP